MLHVTFFLIELTDLIVLKKVCPLVCFQRTLSILIVLNLKPVIVLDSFDELTKVLGTFPVVGG